MDITPLVTAAALSLAWQGPALPPIPVQAGDGALSVMAGIGGRCERFTVGERSFPCSTMIYQQYANGRVVFLVPLGPEGVLAFSGGSDERVSPTDYRLQLDAVRMAEKGSSVVSHDATGECRVRTNRASDRFDSIVCEAAAGPLGDVRLSFTGDRKRADIQTFPKR
ncbi:hypothetical protein [Alsobacter sp. R-9]